MENPHIMPTSDALTYLKEAGIEYFDFNRELRINSGFGLAFDMPNGKVLLMPSNLKDNYPSLLYNTCNDFIKAKEEDIFPIPLESMEWLEKHSEKVCHFLKQNVIENALSLKLEYIDIYRNEIDCYEAFYNARKLIRKKNISNEEMNNIIYIIAINMIKYLNVEKKYNITFVKKYATYNHYWYPLIVHAKNHSLDVIGNTIIFLKSKSKFAAEDYYSSIT